MGYNNFNNTNKKYSYECKETSENPVQAYPYCKRGRESKIPLPESEKVLLRLNRKPGDFTHLQHPNLWVGRRFFYCVYQASATIIGEAFSNLIGNMACINTCECFKMPFHPQGCGR